MSPLPRQTPMYLQVGADPMFALLHEPADASRRDTAVLICPPFGWEEICSHRSRRDWAIDLASAGYPAMRIDLPSTGDSGGSPRDPDRLGAWTAAVMIAGDHLRERTGCGTIAAIGIGLGGLLLCKAISEGAEIEEVVLWGAPARGKAFIRELRAFARLEEAQTGTPTDEQRPRDELTAGGFVLTGETVRAIEGFDLTEISPPAHPRRALLLDRDGFDLAQGLAEHLRAGGTSVEVASGAGYGQIVSEPHLSRAPAQTFAQVQRWLAEDQPRDAADGRRVSPARVANRAETTPHQAADLGRVRETPWRLEQASGNLVGILAEPAAPDKRSGLCAVLLNAGAIRHVGPNRMWVEISRRWAEMGVSTLRVDVQGIGDADGASDQFSDVGELYAPHLVEQVRAVLDALDTRGTGNRFALVGLCSGACWAFHCAMQDRRVTAAVMLNPRALFWDPLLDTMRELRRGVLRPSAWGRIVGGEVSVARMVDFARRAARALPDRSSRRRYARLTTEQLEDALDRLSRSDVRVRFLFSGNEPLHEELDMGGYTRQPVRWPNMTVETMPGNDHTLRALPCQDQVRATMDLIIADIVGASV